MTTKTENAPTAQELRDALSDDRLYTTGEVALMATALPAAVRAWCKSGSLHGRKVGGRWKVRGDEVRRFLGLPKEGGLR